METNRGFYLGAASAVAGGMLLLALLPWPYAYYQLLRLVVTLAGFFLAGAAHSANQRALLAGLIVAILIFNPLIPLHMEREHWSILNVIGAAVFGLAWFQVRKGALS